MKRYGSISLRFAGVLLMFCGGCSPSEPLDLYGEHEGRAARRSVSALTVFRSMFKSAGHRSYTLEALADRAVKLDAIVWIPTDFIPPGRSEMDWFDDWLSANEDKKTLIFIGRDFCGASQYWSQAAEKASSAVAIDMRIEQALIQSQHDLIKARGPSRAYYRWFVSDNQWPESHVDSITGPWAQGLVVADTDLVSRGRILPVNRFTEAELNRDFTWKPTLNLKLGTGKSPIRRAIKSQLEKAEAALLDVKDPIEDQHRNIQCDVLLADGQGTPLIFRIAKPEWGESEILVLANASPILNAQLIRREHQKIASKIVASLRPNSRIGFLLTEGAIPIRTPGDESQVHGFGLLVVWPLNMVTLHAAFLGLLTLAALYPIFGRARSLPRVSTTDFGQHVDALGILLLRSRDRGYALASIRSYFRNVRGEASHPWANVENSLESGKSVEVGQAIASNPSEVNFQESKP